MRHAAQAVGTLKLRGANKDGTSVGLAKTGWGKVRRRLQKLILIPTPPPPPYSLSNAYAVASENTFYNYYNNQTTDVRSTTTLFKTSTL